MVDAVDLPAPHDLNQMLHVCAIQVLERIVFFPSRRYVFDIGANNTLVSKLLLQRRYQLRADLAEGTGYQNRLRLSLPNHDLTLDADDRPEPGDPLCKAGVFGGKHNRINILVGARCFFSHAAV